MAQGKQADTKKVQNTNVPEKPAHETASELPVAAAEAHYFTSSAPSPLIKPKHILALQRTVGNQTVQRLVSQKSGAVPPIQRTPVNERVFSEEVTYGKTFEIGKDLGYIVLNEVSVSAKGEYSVKLNKPAENPNSEEKSGVVVDLSERKAGIKHETKTTWEDSSAERYTGFKPQFVEGGELTTKGGKLMFEGTIEHQRVSFAVEFSLFDAEKTESGIDLDILKVSPKVKIPLIKDLPINDGQGVLSVEEEISISFTPNYKRIAQWISTRFAAAAAAEAIFVGGSVAVVVGSLVGLCITLADAKELGQIPDRVGHQIIAYAKGYNDAMHNQSNGIGWYYTEGLMDGSKQLTQALESGKAPPSVIMEEAAKKDYFWEAATTISQALKSAALQEWEETHWFDMNIDGGKGKRYLQKALDGLNLSLLM